MTQSPSSTLNARYLQDSGKSHELTLENGQELVLVQIFSPGLSEKMEIKSHFKLKKNAKLSVLTVFHGGVSILNENTIELQGEGAEVSFKALSVLGGESQVYCGVSVDHQVPHCKSRQVYKSILSAKSKSTFDSLVHVRPGADKSDSQQLNKNLLLSDSAQSVSRPKLRIDADDVQAAHGSATGQLEEKELFYLQTRGIAKAEARRLLTFGFAEDILKEIQDLTLRAKMEEVVNQLIA